jgi:hypothetical protein
MAAATTSPPRSTGPAAPARLPRRASAGADRVTVFLITAALFLGVLAFLAFQLSATVAPAAHRMVVVRRIYETRVVETIRGGGSGTSVSQSVSSSGSGALPAAPVTRSSTAP